MLFSTRRPERRCHACCHDRLFDNYDLLKLNSGDRLSSCNRQPYLKPASLPVRSAASLYPVFSHSLRPPGLVLLTWQRFLSV